MGKWYSRRSSPVYRMVAPAALVDTEQWGGNVVLQNLRATRRATLLTGHRPGCTSVRAVGAKIWRGERPAPPKLGMKLSWATRESRPSEPRDGDAVTTEVSESASEAETDLPAMLAEAEAEAAEAEAAAAAARSKVRAMRSQQSGKQADADDNDEDERGQRKPPTPPLAPQLARCRENSRRHRHRRLTGGQRGDRLAASHRRGSATPRPRSSSRPLNKA